jgi:hypothetical protein
LVYVGHSGISDPLYQVGPEAPPNLTRAAKIEGNPNKSARVALDTRGTPLALLALLDRHNPNVPPASGRMGVSVATRL